MQQCAECGVFWNTKEPGDQFMKCETCDRIYCGIIGSYSCGHFHGDICQGCHEGKIMLQFEKEKDHKNNSNQLIEDMKIWRKLLTDNDIDKDYIIKKILDCIDRFE